MRGEQVPKSLGTGDVDSAADLGEGAVGIGAKGGDRRDAKHDDQGQHDSSLDRRWPVFTFQKVHGAQRHSRKHCSTPGGNRMISKSSTARLKGRKRVGGLHLDIGGWATATACLFRREAV